jgi:NitT/TauT family transport system permease protein
MSMRRDSWQAWVAVIAAVAAITLPLMRSDPPVYLLGLGFEGVIVAAVVGLSALFSTEPGAPSDGVGLLFIGSLVGGVFVLLQLPQVAALAATTDQSVSSFLIKTEGFWALVIASWLLGWLLVSRLASVRPHDRIAAAVTKMLVPPVFVAGILLALLLLWAMFVSYRGGDSNFAPLLRPSASVGGLHGFWAMVAGCWLIGWLLMSSLAAIRPMDRLEAAVIKVVVPFLFGVWLLFLWEVIVRGMGVPPVLLPPPSAIWLKLVGSLPTLWADFRQTFLKAVIAGFAIGSGAGFLVAILVDRIAFLKRGLLPIGNLVSALPIIGIAPIMVMWFGFDWQSKAAVVVIMTFFPMLVNTVAGLDAAEHTQRDLMRTYAAGYFTTLLKLRLPAALPFIFNGLKINSTLALIGAIVAEFFGTPIVGMGFRISTEVGRMAIDMVWAEIAVAALAGSVFYGVVALIERAVTFWHPSFRT